MHVLRVGWGGVCGEYAPFSPSLPPSWTQVDG